MLPQRRRITDELHLPIAQAYQPCDHDGPCAFDNLLCVCRVRDTEPIRGVLCEKFCQCPLECEFAVLFSF